MNNYPWLEAFLLALPGVTRDFKPEWGFMNYRAARRLFAVTCTPDARYKRCGGRELVTLRCDERFGDALKAQYADIIDGFYSDRRYWISVFLDSEEVPPELLRRLCENAHAEILRRAPKRVREALKGGGKIEDL